MLRPATFSFVAILEISNHPFLIACCDHKRRVAMCLALPAPSLEKKLVRRSNRGTIWSQCSCCNSNKLNHQLKIARSASGTCPQSTCQLPPGSLTPCSRGLWKLEHGNGCKYSTRSEMQFHLKLTSRCFATCPICIAEKFKLIRFLANHLVIVFPIGQKILVQLHLWVMNLHLFGVVEIGGKFLERPDIADLVGLAM